MEDKRGRRRVNGIARAKAKRVRGHGRTGVKPSFWILLKKDDISLNLSGNILKKMILTNSFIFPKNII